MSDVGMGSLQYAMPGVTDTDMNKDWLANSEANAAAASASVFGRIGIAKDVADVVIFVAPEEARWVTGKFIDATVGDHL